MKIKKICIYEVETIMIGDYQSPIFTDSASEALSAYEKNKSAGFRCRLYKHGKLIMFCGHRMISQ